MVPNKLGVDVVDWDVPNWKAPMAGCLVWGAFRPNVGWVCVAGVPKVILPVPKVSGAVVLR